MWELFVKTSVPNSVEERRNLMYTLAEHSYCYCAAAVKLDATAVTASVTLATVLFTILLLASTGSGLYALIMSAMDVWLPKISAKTPKMRTRMFFQMRQFPAPNPTSQYVTISIKIGKMRPRSEKANAPIRPMKGPIVGTAIASPTAATTSAVLTTYSYTFGFLTKLSFTPFQTISRQTKNTRPNVQNTATPMEMLAIWGAL